MADAQKRGFRLNSKPFVVFRVVAYLIIILCLWLWGRSNRRPASVKRSPAPAPAPVKPSSGQALGVIDLGTLYPSLTLYGWSARPASDGRQQVDVLVRFGQPSGQVKFQELGIEFRELKLRAKGSIEDLAEAVPSEAGTDVSEGQGRLTFYIPSGKPEFRAGKVFLRTKDLCILNSNQRLAPKDFDKWADQMEAGETLKERPDAVQPDGALPVTPQAAHVPTAV